MKSILLLLIAASILFSCKKNRVNAKSKVEIYLLESVSLYSNRCEVNPVGATLQTFPLVSNDEILQYDVSNYVFYLKRSAVEKIQQVAGRTPFALTVDREVIYYGFHMPLIMSSTCFESITMHLTNQPPVLVMNSGYPGAGQAINEYKKRNDPRLIAALSAQRKLR